MFSLMNGMHGSGLFLPLAAAAGVIGFDRYAEIQCQGFQPDAPQAQEIRQETAFISLYGELTRHIPQ